MEKQDTSQPEPAGTPLGIPPSFDEQLNLMFDIIALAYQANLTRIFTFMMAKEATDRTYQSHRRSGFVPRHFPSSEPAKEAGAAWKDSGVQHRGLRQIPCETCEDARWRRHRCWIIRSFSYGSNMSNSNAHNHSPLPTAIVGGGHGKDQRRPAS